MASASPSSPPSIFDTEVPPSTAASSPPPEDGDYKLNEEDEDEQHTTKANLFNLADEDMDARLTHLNFVLEKSATYSDIIRRSMNNANSKIYLPLAVEKPSSPRSKGKKVDKNTRRGKGKKRVVEESDDEDDTEGPSKRQKTAHDPASESEPAVQAPVLRQPSLITGATLKQYQLEGVHWMASLHNNGISGILADEMGLGKTLQTIAFSAYLREVRFLQPFLVVCPLSVLHNWVEEYAKFAPDIPVCMYHGTPAERAALRRDVLRTELIPPERSSNENAEPVPNTKPKRKGRGRPKSTTNTSSGRRGKGRARGSGRPSATADADGTDETEEKKLSPEEQARLDEENERATTAALSFPVVITTYEMIIKDRVHLSPEKGYRWGYIVVDEGHRLKNLDCKLMKEIKKYSTASRMILTGTPLHNNLAELWALLNFVLPDIFNDVDSFQEWFNLPTMQMSVGSDRAAQIVDALHAILKPFLLRRLKADVEANLPPKKEYVLYAPLSIAQRETYDKILEGTLRAHLMKGQLPAVLDSEENKANSVSKDDADDTGSRRLRSKDRKTKKSYVVDGDDDEYFEMLERDDVDRRGLKENKSDDLAKLNEAYRQDRARKKVNNMKLQNTVMQLRKVCSHPFLFDWPVDSRTLQPILDDDLVAASGKMMVLDRLLTELFKRKHKVLLFSQFTTMLDIIEDWAQELKGWAICRIDGSTGPLERREQMRLFQEGGDTPDAPCLFLLSTRAGGLGINLVSADTVIFYDQDWNPQMDAQAQDRAHRIGQTKPVLIFRLVSAHTIETKIMQRATQKRQLEALVIANGKFKTPAAAAQHGKKAETIAEMAASLLRLEGEKIDVVPNTNEGKANVLSDSDLNMLLDRSPEVFADRRKGWTSAGEVPVGATEVEGKKPAFAVYEAPNDEGNDALAKMLGEDVE